MAALLVGVMQRAISAGSEQVARQLSGEEIAEQRDGKQSQKHLSRHPDSQGLQHIRQDFEAPKVGDTRTRTLSALIKPLSPDIKKCLQAGQFCIQLCLFIFTCLINYFVHRINI